MAHEVHLELLLGRMVVDAVGDRVGRIEEVLAEEQDGEWVIVEYLVGLSAIAERLSTQRISTELLRLLGIHRFREGYHIPWDKLDISDPHHPRLTCPLADLAVLNR